MNTDTGKTKSPAEQALELLEQAWAYYTPQPVLVKTSAQPELFEYANAA